MNNRDAKCLVPACERKVYARGLCANHRSQAAGMVIRGVASEEDLMRRGLLLRPKYAETRKRDVAAIFMEGSDVEGSGVEPPEA